MITKTARNYLKDLHQFMKKPRTLLKIKPNQRRIAKLQEELSALNAERRKHMDSLKSPFDNMKELMRINERKKEIIQEGRRLSKGTKVEANLYQQVGAGTGVAAAGYGLTQAGQGIRDHYEIVNHSG